MESDDELPGQAMSQAFSTAGPRSPAPLRLTGIDACPCDASQAREQTQREIPGYILWPLPRSSAGLDLVRCSGGR